MNFEDLKIVLIYVKSNHNYFAVEGTISLLVNVSGIIESWKTHLTSITLDLLTTKSWFLLKNSNFKNRAKLFNLLGIKLEARENKKDHKPYQITIEQIDIVNKFINTDYDGTLNNLIALFKGSNPRGKYSFPDKAEMKTQINEIYIDFVLFVSYLLDKEKKKVSLEQWKDLENKLNIIDFITYIEEDQYLLSLIEIYNSKFLNLSKKSNISLCRNIIIHNIKQILFIYTQQLQEIKFKVQQHRNKFKKNIENKYCTIDDSKSIIFGENWIGNCECSHIKPVHMIVKEIKNKYPNKSEDLYQQISSPYNFLPLDPNTHSDFDKKYIYWDNQGVLCFLNNQNIRNIDEYKKFQQIMPDHLKNSLEYLNWYQKWVNSKFNLSFI